MSITAWPLAWLVGALLGAPAPAEHFTVQLKVVGVQGVIVPVMVEIRAASDDNAKVILRREAMAPGAIRLPLPAEASWLVYLTAAGYWSAPRQFDSSADLSEFEIELWRATEVHGQLLVSERTPSPHAIALRLQSHDGRSRPQIARTTLVCPVDGEGSFRCSAPRVPGADLRFRVPGFASRFFWDVDLTKDQEFNTGELTLRPGASVVGQVTVTGRAAAEEVTIELAPARRSPYAPVPQAEVDDEQARLSSRPDPHGFFALEGLDPGVYRLTARHPGLAAAEVEPIRVVEGAQTLIEVPIVMAPAEPLLLNVEPQFDPDQGDWRLRIFSSSLPGQHSARPVAEVDTVAGFVKTAGIALGFYEIEVLDSLGREVQSARISHSGSSGMQSIVVTSLRVVGRVNLGEDPLLALVSFHRLAVDRTAETDPEGSFQILLPAEGIWEVEVVSEFPEVAWYEPEVELKAKEGIAQWVLNLPGTHLSGTVVDADGQARAGAEITVDTRIPVSRQSDSDGHFAFHGLEEGPHKIVATAGDAFSSEPESIELQEGHELEVQLVLGENQILEGRFLDAAGNALPGLWLLTDAFTASGARRSFGDSTSTADTQGRFRFLLGKSTTEVFLMALVPGVGTRSVLLEPGNVGDIVVGPETGTLQLDLEVPAAWDRRFQPLPVLVTPAGLRVPCGALIHWASLNGVANDPLDTSFTFPLLELGTYRACWLGPADFSSRFSTGTGCVAGELRAGATVTMRLAKLGGADDK